MLATVPEEPTLLLIPIAPGWWLERRCWASGEVEWCWVTPVGAVACEVARA